MHKSLLRPLHFE